MVVHGLSDAGQRLVGALTFARPGTEPWRPGAERVLLLDGVVAGLEGVAIAAYQLRRMGATCVDACVVQLISDENPSPDVGELYVLADADERNPAALAA